MTEKRGSMTRRKTTNEQTPKPTNGGMGAAFPDRTERLKRLSVDLPEDQHRKLKRIATDRGTTVRNIILDKISELDG